MFSKYKIQNQTTLKRIIIQTIPGLKLDIYKNSEDEEPLPYIISGTGILDLSSTENNHLIITGFTLDENNRKTLYNLEDGYLIVTVIYELMEEEI